jgi:hypothetical protein
MTVDTEAARTYYIHAWVGDTGGRVTVAIMVKHYHHAYAGVAWCSPKDNFCRRIGRLIAEGRARAYCNNPLFMLAVPSPVTRAWLASMLRLVANKITRPQWAVGELLVTAQSHKKVALDA